MRDRGRIVHAIRAIAREMGRAPSRAEFTRRTGISKYFVLKWFCSWTEAVRAAGMMPSALNARVEDGALLEEWGRVVRENGGVLPRHMFRRTAKYNPLTLAKRFGGWSGVPQAFRRFARRKREWGDVVAVLPRYVRKGSGLRRQGRVPRGPSSENLNLGHRRLALPVNGRRLGNENAMAAGARRKKWNAALGDRPTYGNPMAHRWLQHEPVNEQGVVLLFGMMAKELGYVIEMVQNGFPDCEAKRQVGPDRWQRVRIEFEYESRNFAEHGHRAEGCDVIVCWKHNWEECPKRIEVVELWKKLEGGD